MGWNAIDDLFEELRQREEDIDEALRQRYADGEQAIAVEREERIREGSYGRLPR